MIIAIDGPAGSGKTTTAKLVAKRLGVLHLDTGAMYRCITLKALKSNISYQSNSLLNLSRETNIEFVLKNGEMRVLMDDEDVSDQIRMPDVTKNVSDYCAVPFVREILVDQQRRIASRQSTVLEGRDIGTVVFPNADLKIFLVAKVETRALRRKKELDLKGINKTVEELIEDIKLRDKKDSEREHSPLRKAEDAIEIDTSNLTIEEQVDIIVKKAQALL